MKILALGLNHATASIDLREQAAFAPEAVAPALRELTRDEGVSEATILSTCNRTEIYCGQNDDSHELDDGEGRILHWFSRRTGFSPAELAASVYHFPNEQAVKHAFRVASGLDSMVLGEPQILGQMKDAFHTAAHVGATGKVLNRLFQHTFSVAKQVRTDTAIGTHSVSVAYAGVSLAKRVFARLSEQTALLIGAGETIELVARHLQESGIGRIVIANRSIHKARTLAQAVDLVYEDNAYGNSEAIALGQIPERLAAADLVISSTASTLPILGKGAVERAIAQRKHKPMFILDLAVPRDVEPEVSRLRDVYLYTVDDLHSVVAQHRDLRAQAIPSAESIIDLQVVRFMRWMRSLESVPAIRALRGSLDEIGARETAKALRKIRNSEDPEAVVQQLARNLTNQFAHRPSAALKHASVDGNPELLAAARKLFGFKG